MSKATKKHACLLTVPKDMINQPGDLITMMRSMKKIAQYRLLKQSLRLMNVTVMMSEQHGDCFIKNELAVLIEGDGYKIPRIIKNLLLKKAE